MEYIITSHAMERFKQRTRLYYRHADKRSLKVLMEDTLRKSYREPKFDLYPFFLNRRGLSEVRVNGDFKFFIVGNRVVTFVVNNNPQWWKF